VKSGVTYCTSIPKEMVGRLSGNLQAVLCLLSLLSIQAAHLNERELSHKARSHVSVGVTRDGHAHASTASSGSEQRSSRVQLQSRRESRQIMRHESRRGDDQNQSPPDASADDIMANSTDMDSEAFHSFDAGGNCPRVSLIEYPTRYDRATVKCLTDDTEHLNVTCHSAAPDAGENRVMLAYRGKANHGASLYERFKSIFANRGRH